LILQWNISIIEFRPHPRRSSSPQIR
jgi:hypothetical protein